MVASSNGRAAVLVDGCRIPFQRSGTGYVDLSAYDMARMVLKGLFTRTGFDAAEVERVIMGCVVQNVETSNVAREAALAAGVPNHVPAFTVTMACISSNQAVTSGVDLIRGGIADVVVAGGTETLSDPPIQVKRSVRKRLFKAQKAKSPGDYLQLLKGLRPSDVVPEAPSIAEFSTGEVMGESADKLAAMFDVSREEQDEYGLLTHKRSAEAQADGRLQKELVPASPPPDFEPINSDNTIRADSTMEKLSSLSPVFVKPFGTVTAGNSSPLTDGASATLLMSEDRTRAEGFEPIGYLRDYVYVAQDPGDELLLGPAYAIPKLLNKAGLSIADIDVFELHEAFAGQVLAVLAALRSESFARNNLNQSNPAGEIPMDKLNTRGGSVSLGHPFGATGARLVTTAANRLHEEDGELALLSACAAGGQGVAMLIERA